MLANNLSHISSLQRNPTCPKCNGFYVTKEHNRQHRNPLILECGHTFCEGCLTKIARESKTSIACPTCKAVTPLPQGEASVRNLWPDVYVTGWMICQQRALLNQELEKLSPAGIVQNPGFRGTSDRGEREKMCRECFRRLAMCRCDKCDVIMCHGCFDKVHSKSNTLKQHQPLPIDSEDSLKGELTQDCPLHEGRELEYYCEDEKTPICSKCVIFGEHKGHVITSMEEKNKTLFSEMEPALHLANKVVRKLIKVDKSMTDFFPDTKVETASVICEIRDHFQELHGLLQAREKHLIDEVFAAYKEGVEPLENLRRQMQDERMKLEVSIRAAQRVLNNNNEVTLNARQILDQLNRAKEIPCIVLPKETETTEKISFIENDSLATSILGHGKVVGKSQVRATWHTLSEMPAEIMNDDDSMGSHTPVDTISVVSTPYSQESEEVIIEDEQDCSIVGGVELGRQKSTESPGSYPQAGQRLSAPRCRIRGKNEFVTVTHIINPCKFMVQLKEDQSPLRKLSRQINSWANTSGTMDIPTEIKPGDLVIVKYTQDNDWYRSRVKQVLGKNNVNQMQLEVLYIDFGNSEIVGLDRVRKMQTRFQNHPEFMVECSLFDIIPPDTGGWSKEAIKQFCKMTDNKTLYMTVIREVNNVLHVDLSKPALDMTKNEVPISIRDALVFLEYAQFVTPESGNITGKPAVMRQYIKPEPHYEGEIFNVIVTSVTDPHNFYIQECMSDGKLGDVSTYFAEMMNKMQRVYTKENAMELWSIYCPKKDMVCSCQYSLDKMFYRALITNLPGRKQVDVFYVDFGNRERVHYSQLRMLLDEFLILPAQAVKCRLVDVEPKDSKTWSESAKQWWTKKVNLNKFTVKIAEVPDNKVYSVVLMNEFDEDKPQISLNSELVSKGYANSTGDRSLPVPEEQLRHMAAGSEESLTDSSTRSSSMVLGRESTSVSTESLPSSATSLTPGTSPRKLCSPAPEGNVSDSSTGARKKTRHASSQKKKSKIQKSSEEELDVEVKIGQFTDPSCFYVYVVDENLTRIMDDMDEEYRDSEPQWINWEEGQFCAARRPEDGRWYRARIEQVIHKNLVKVFLVDFGFTETIQTSELRSLRKDFSQDAAFAFLCHLAEVVPAGDQSTWSRTACELMLDETQGKKLYIKKKGEKVKMSAPVDLILETDVPESALEPSRKSYTSLIEMMKDKGLVIPTSGALSRKKTPVKAQPKTYPIMFYDPPILPEEDSFVGIPVYVNFDAVIFVQEVRQDDEFKDMSEEIQKRFMDSEPHKFEDMNWQLNQACIAFFHLDEHWYRAKILSLETHRVKVKFVDFGNCEILSYDKIRADVQDFMYLPPQCFECVLYNILPTSDSGKWPKEVLDYMHKSCVTKACVIDVVERVEGEPLKVKVMLPDHQDFASVLEREGLAVKEDSLLELMLHSQAIEKVLKTNNPYKSMPSFSPGEYFTVLITHVEVPNVVYYQHTRYSGDEADERTDEINEQLTRLEQMWVELNEAGPVAPPLKRPRPGMMCCAQFAVDQCWYRGLVITSPDHQNQVLVLYVDFGTSEIVTLDRVRSLPPEFHSLPAQASRLILSGIQLPSSQSSWTRQAQEEMLRVVGAQVVQCSLKKLEPLEGELFSTEDWNNIKLVYQELIDNGILQYSEETDFNFFPG